MAGRALGSATGRAVCLCLVLAACLPAITLAAPRKLMETSPATSDVLAEAAASPAARASTASDSSTLIVHNSDDAPQMPHVRDAGNISQDDGHDEHVKAQQSGGWTPPGGLPGNPGLPQQPCGGYNQPPCPQQPCGGYNQPPCPQQPCGGYNQPPCQPYYPPQQPCGGPGQYPCPQQPCGGYNQPPCPQQPCGGYNQPPCPQQPCGGYNQPPCQPYYPPQQPCGGPGQHPCPQQPCGGYNQPPCPQQPCGGYNQPPCPQQPCGGYNQPPCQPYYPQPPYNPCACVNNICQKGGLTDGVPLRCSALGQGACTPVGGIEGCQEAFEFPPTMRSYKKCCM